MTKLECEKYEKWLLNGCYKELSEEIEPCELPIGIQPSGAKVYNFTEVNYSNQELMGMYLAGTLSYILKGYAMPTENGFENTKKHQIILGNEFFEFIRSFTKRVLTAYKKGEDKYKWLKYNAFPQPIQNEQLFNPREKFVYYYTEGFLIYDILGPTPYNLWGNYGLIYLMPLYVRNLACSSDVDVRPMVKDILEFYERNLHNDNINYVLRTLAPYFIFYLGSFCTKEEKDMVENYLSVFCKNRKVIEQVETNYFYAKYIDDANIEMHKKMIMSCDFWDTKMINDLNEVAFKKRK